MSWFDLKGSLPFTTKHFLKLRHFPWVFIYGVSSRTVSFDGSSLKLIAFRPSIVSNIVQRQLEMTHSYTLLHLKLIKREEWLRVDLIVKNFFFLRSNTQSAWWLCFYKWGMPWCSVMLWWIEQQEKSAGLWDLTWYWHLFTLGCSAPTQSVSEFQSSVCTYLTSAASEEHTHPGELGCLIFHGVSARRGAGSSEMWSYDHQAMSSGS